MCRNYNEELFDEPKSEAGHLKLKLGLRAHKSPFSEKQFVSPSLRLSLESLFFFKTHFGITLLGGSFSQKNTRLESGHVTEKNLRTFFPK